MIRNLFLPVITLFIFLVQTIIFWQQKDFMGQQTQVLSQQKDLMSRQTQILEQQTKIQLNQTLPYVVAVTKSSNSRIVTKLKNQFGIVRGLKIESITCLFGSTNFPDKNVYGIVNCLENNNYILGKKSQDLAIKFNPKLEKLWKFYNISDTKNNSKTEFISIIKAKYIDVSETEKSMCFEFFLGLSENIKNRDDITSFVCNDRPVNFIISEQIDINSIKLEDFKSKI